MSYAYCSRDGAIEIARSVPDGRLELARGPARDLRRAVSARSRHAYDGKTFLVPGIPEADSDGEALSAAERFAAFLTRGKPALVNLLPGAGQ
jgi:hypothetical protein